MHFHAQESESKVGNRFLNFVLCSILACRYFKKYFRLNQIRISQPSCTGWLVAERESKVDGWSVGRIDGRTDGRTLAWSYRASVARRQHYRHRLHTERRATTPLPRPAPLLLLLLLPPPFSFFFTCACECTHIEHPLDNID